MAEKPILFSGPMVRALLDGRKTQTRRILKPQPFIDRLGNLCAPGRRHGDVVCYGQDMKGKPFWRDYPLPYAVGDRLWVRETFCGHLGPLPAHMQETARTVPENGGTHLWYRADDDTKPFHHSRWTPSIHMPKWAARIWLTVTNVRAQRLQEMSEEDARAEGVRPAFTRTTKPDWPVAAQPHYVWGFEELWDSIHDAGAWEADPWVAAYSFEVARVDG